MDNATIFVLACCGLVFVIFMYALIFSLASIASDPREKPVDEQDEIDGAINKIVNFAFKEREEDSDGRTG
jgi:hypothetical protein